MSSNLRIQRICQHCSNEFTAKTTVTKYCSDICAKRAYKQKLRNSKVELSNNEVQQIKIKPIEQLKAKDFLTVRDVAVLLNCSIRTTYRLIEQRNIKAVNIAQRKTLVKRSEIDKLFEQPHSVAPQSEQILFDVSECYSLTEVQNKYGISEKALYEIIKRNSIPQIKRGWFTYIPKVEIDNLFNLNS